MQRDRIFGINPVLEALKAGRQIRHLLIADQRSRDSDVLAILRLASKAGISVRTVDRSALNREVPNAVHQGIVAVTAARAYASLDDIIQKPAESGQTPLYLVLDGIEDPRNLGAILRTAETAGVHGVVVPERRAAGLTETVAKASAGALEYVPVVKVVNIARTLDELKKTGVWVFGAESDSKTIYWTANFTGPVALVLGGEDRGIRRLVREKCDYMISLPLKGKICSLNVSVAAGILLYEVIRQRSAAT